MKLYRRFDEFFATRILDETGETEIDVERLDELRSLAAQRKEGPTEPPIEPPDVPPGSHEADLEWKRRLLAIGKAVVPLAVYMEHALGDS